MSRWKSESDEIGGVPSQILRALGRVPGIILLVEDNRTDAYVIMNYLTEAGHKVHHAENGTVAVVLAAETRYDAILIDISMSGMNGVQTAAAIRSLSSVNSDTPIIALAAHDAGESQPLSLSIFINGYLQKPISKSNLLSTISVLGATNVNSAMTTLDDESNDPVIDKKVFTSFLRERSPDRSVTTLEVFVRELEEKAELLERIIPNQESAALHLLAHSSVGSGSMVGAGRLVRVSRMIADRRDNSASLNWAIAEDLLLTIKVTIEAFNLARGRAAIVDILRDN